MRIALIFTTFKFGLLYWADVFRRCHMSRRLPVRAMSSENDGDGSSAGLVSRGSSAESSSLLYVPSHLRRAIDEQRRFRLHDLTGRHLVSHQLLKEGRASFGSMEGGSAEEVRMLLWSKRKKLRMSNRQVHHHPTIQRRHGV